jgi:DNA-binding NtrC family response regulator
MPTYQDSVRPANGVGKPSSTATVLVVDDRADVAGTIAELCRARGVAAVASREGEVIRDLLRRHHPAGVILDVMMPEEDGFEALKEIAVYHHALPVLLITGHGETWLRMGATLARAHGLDAVRTSTKPIRAATLADFIAVARAFSGGHPY